MALLDILQGANGSTAAEAAQVRPLGGAYCKANQRYSMEAADLMARFAPTLLASQILGLSAGPISHRSRTGCA